MKKKKPPKWKTGWGWKTLLLGIGLAWPANECDWPAFFGGVPKDSQTEMKAAIPVLPPAAPETPKDTVEVDAHPSEAVILFVGAEMRDPKDRDSGFTRRHIYCQKMMRDIGYLQQGFTRQGVPCYVIGNSEEGFTIDGARENIAALINAYHYKALTGIVMCHGWVSGVDHLMDMPSPALLDSLKSDDVWHRVTIGYDRKKDEFTRLPIGDFFRNLSPDSLVWAGAKDTLLKQDYVLGTCFSGAVKQKEVDLLPKGSTVVAGCAAKDEASPTSLVRLGGLLDGNKAKDGVDALDLGRISLYNASQITETNMVFYVSGNPKGRMSADEIARGYYGEKRPAELLLENRDALCGSFAAYRSVVTESFFNKMIAQKDSCYDGVAREQKPVMQAFALDKTVFFRNEPGRLQRYRGFYGW